MKRIVLATGGFDPIHRGHIEYLKHAKSLGNILIVGLNSDAWLTRKKGQPFMTVNDRLPIVECLEFVDGTLLFNDDDGSATNAIEILLKKYDRSTIIFANGGDRYRTNTLELERFADHPRVEFAWDIGGGKQNSSSTILDTWHGEKVIRDWGWWRVLKSFNPGAKAKELWIEPEKSISWQTHKYRSEDWTIVEGSAIIQTALGDRLPRAQSLYMHQTVSIPAGTWHTATGGPRGAHILELQYGKQCVEDDIIRGELP